MEKNKSSSPDFNVRQFFARFPDDEACLVHIFNVRYGARHVCRACGVEATFHRLTNRRAWACAACGDNLYPTAGTVFQDTRTPLQTWFYAIYLFVTTRHGVSGKELQRRLGVTYKTAWRIGQKIREQIGNADFQGLLSGHVEADETYVGGKRHGGKRGRGAPGKTVVMGIKERDGAVKATVVPNVRMNSLRGVINDQVEKGTFVSSDELASYNLLTGDGYTHGRVSHSAKQWTKEDGAAGELISTNGIESFWRMFKVSVRSTHIFVSEQHMSKYLAEFTFRANHRQEVNRMFDRLVAQF